MNLAFIRNIRTEVMDKCSRYKRTSFWMWHLADLTMTNCQVWQVAGVWCHCCIAAVVTETCDRFIQKYLLHKNLPVRMIGCHTRHNHCNHTSMTGHTYCWICGWNCTRIFTEYRRRSTFFTLVAKTYGLCWWLLHHFHVNMFGEFTHFFTCHWRYRHSH